MARLIQKLILLIGLCGSTALRAEHLVIFSDDIYPPVSYTHNSQPAGIMPLLLARISRLTGDTYEIR